MAFFDGFWWYKNPYLPQTSLCLFSFNETHWRDPEYLALYHQALATVDTEKRKALCQEMMLIEHERGPYIIPYFVPEMMLRPEC